MKAKKNFKETISGADKLFSANDPTTDAITDEKTDKSEEISSNMNYSILSNVYSNILDSIQNNEPPGSNVTFYLSKETSNAVTLAAKAKKISRSKLVDGISKQVLMNDI